MGLPRARKVSATDAMPLDRSRSATILRIAITIFFFFWFLVALYQPPPIPRLSFRESALCGIRGKGANGCCTFVQQSCADEQVAYCAAKELGTIPSLVQCKFEYAASYQRLWSPLSVQKLRLETLYNTATSRTGKEGQSEPRPDLILGSANHAKELTGAPSYVRCKSASSQRL